MATLNLFLPHMIKNDDFIQCVQIIDKPYKIYKHINRDLHIGDLLIHVHSYMDNGFKNPPDNYWWVFTNKDIDGFTSWHDKPISGKYNKNLDIDTSFTNINTYIIWTINRQLNPNTKTLIKVTY